MIARNFEFDLDESAGPVREAFEFAIVPRGLRVRLRERTHTAPSEAMSKQPIPRAATDDEVPRNVQESIRRPASP
jgi:hypothetical protein